MLPMLAAAVAPAIIGALANRDSGSSSGSQSSMRNVAAAGAQEQYGSNSVEQMLRQLQGMSSAGPGQQDVSNAYGAQNDLAAMLKQYSQGGYQPQQQDFQYAQAMTAPQQEQIRQQGIQANQNFRQIAAQTGRGAMDFAFTNKLNQQLGNWQNQLGAQQQQIAAQQPMQRLGFMQDFAGIKQGLASQAQQNRLAIANLGASIRDAGSNFRLSAAGGQTFTNQQVGSQTGNMITGALAGVRAAPGLMNMFGGSGNASPAIGPQAGGSYKNFGGMA